MAVIVQLKSGNWRVQVRRKGQYASSTFLRKCDADTWAVQAARDIDNGKKPAKRARKQAAPGAKTFGNLIDLHIDDLAELGKPLGRSKDYVLRRLKEDIGATPITDLTKPELIAFGKRRTRSGGRSSWGANSNSKAARHCRKGSGSSIASRKTSTSASRRMAICRLAPTT